MTRDNRKTSSDLLKELDEGRNHKQRRDSSHTNLIMAGVVLLVAAVALYNNGAFQVLAGWLHQWGNVLGGLGG